MPKPTTRRTLSAFTIGGVTSSAYNFSNELITRGHTITFLDLSGKFYNDDLLDERAECLTSLLFKHLFDLVIGHAG